MKKPMPLIHVVDPVDVALGIEPKLELGLQAEVSSMTATLQLLPRHLPSTFLCNLRSKISNIITIFPITKI
jgi:hypothetical protein